MKLLLDQNLPRRLLRDLSEPFPGSEHVRNLGLDSGTSDGQIFEFAREHGFTILSKDSDFRQLSFVRGAPPKVVWLRVGNCTQVNFARWFVHMLSNSVCSTPPVRVS